MTACKPGYRVKNHYTGSALEGKNYAMGLYRLHLRKAVVNCETLCGSFTNMTCISIIIYIITSNKNIHFEMILDVGIGEKRKETRFLI